jgi:hypothetical protein
VLTAVIQNRTANAEFGLDVGSGEGRIANKLREKSGINFIGLEPHLPTSQIIIGNVRRLRKVLLIKYHSITNIRYGGYSDKRI